MSRLTTPVSYLTSLPKDIFAKAQEPPNNGIDFYDERQTRQFLQPRYGVQKWESVPDFGWMMVSVGPDGAIGAPIHNYPGGYSHQGKAIRTLYMVYDPTNGTVSFGNIYLFQGNRSPVDVLFPEN